MGEGARPFLDERQEVEGWGLDEEVASGAGTTRCAPAWQRFLSR